jgi:hemolysin activation/secretion protein
MMILRLASRTACVAVCAATVFYSNTALAQAIERNLPPAPQSQPVSPAPANITPASQDATPIGPTLTGLFLLGPADPVRTPAAGIDTAMVKRMDTPEGRALLAPFLGQPLSRKLIGQVEAAVASYYRRSGYPFVSLSTPEQNITAGVLQIRVIEFHAGEVKVMGAKHPEQIRDGVRLTKGGSIDADQLAQDLDWLNRYPYRHVEAVFSPGEAQGQSDLTLETSETRPYRVYAGYSNSGSSTTNWDRYFLGASVGDLLVPGSLASYQFTASPDAYRGASDPSYLSHGVRFSLPTGQRQDFEGTFDHVEINTTSASFSSKQAIDELTLGYRSAISNVIPLPGDITAGVEAKSSGQHTYFQGVDVRDGLADVYQIYAGYSYAWSDRIGRGDVSTTVHVSPGGIGSHNSTANLSTFSQARVTDATYAYVTVQGDQTFQLPSRWLLSETLVAQYGSSALPQTEQLGLGGQSLVRGYSTDDGSFDNGFVVRSELHAPTISLGQNGWVNATAAYAFLDLAQGWERGTHAYAHPASIGAGLDDQLTERVTASLDYAYVLSSTSATRSGDSKLEARVTVGF